MEASKLIENYLSINNHEDLLKKWQKFEKSQNGEFPTTWAAMNGYTDLLKFMISIGLLLHNSISYKVASAGNLECLKCLKEFDTNWNILYIGKWAACNGDIEMLTYLIESSTSTDLELWRNDEQTLMLACTCENLDAVNYLIRNKFILNRYKCLKIINNLLNANKNIKNKYPIAETIKEIIGNKFWPTY